MLAKVTSCGLWNTERGGLGIEEKEAGRKDRWKEGTLRKEEDG